MNVMKNIVFAGCSVLLLTQCATQDEVRKLNYQIRTVNQKVEDVKATTVNQMQKRQASSVNKIDAVSSETQQLRALVEESDQKSSRLREQTKEDIAALSAAVQQMRAENEQRFKALEARVDQMAGSIDRVQQARVQAAEKRARDAARRAEEARNRTVMAATATTGAYVTVQPDARKIRMGSGKVVNASKSRVSQAPVTTPASTPEPVIEKRVVAAAPVAAHAGSDPFDQGMRSFKAAKYKQAYKTFEQVLAGNPQGAKAAQTLFYMGECLFNQGEYDLAILDYQKVISNHAKDPHTPAALLKQGMSFEKLTDHETAKIIFKKLIADYPDSSEAGLARKRLESI
jgi:tol-pal system protein YbgF